MTASPRRSFALLALAALPACSEPELFVRVTSNEALTPTSLRIEVFGPADLAPAVVETVEVDGTLPQTFSVVRAPASTRSTVRVRVVAMADGIPVAAGDTHGELGDERTEATVMLVAGCESMRCPAFERCDPVSRACDGACASDDGCDLLGRCPGVACDRAVGEIVGACRAVGTDADRDGVSSSTCAWLADGGDCDDADPAIPSGSGPSCNGHRDHDCDGVPDERMMCAGCTALGAFDPAPLRNTFDAPVRAITGVREIEGTLVVIAATDEALVVAEVGGVGTIRAEVAIASTRDVAWEGTVVAAASSAGLFVGSPRANGVLNMSNAAFDADGALSGLTHVALDGAVAWVARSDGMVAAVDVTRPDAPRLVFVTTSASGVTTLGAGGGLACVGAEAGPPSCFTLMGAVIPTALASAPRVRLSLASDPILLLSATGSSVATSALSPSGFSTPLTSSTANEVVALESAGSLLVHLESDGLLVVHEGMTPVARLESSSSRRLPAWSGTPADFTVSVVGSTVFASLARGSTVETLAVECAP